MTISKKNPLNDRIYFNVNSALKRQAITVLNSLDYTLSNALRLFIAKIIAENGLPFSPIISNKNNKKEEYLFKLIFLEREIEMLNSPEGLAGIISAKKMDCEELKLEIDRVKGK